MKRIVFDSPFQHSVTAVEVGIEFERGVAQAVTDEQAAILLATHENKYFESDADLAERLSINKNYRPELNPRYGMQKHPHFRLESDKETPFQREQAEAARTFTANQAAAAAEVASTIAAMEAGSAVSDDAISVAPARAPISAAVTKA